MNVHACPACGTQILRARPANGQGIRGPHRAFEHAPHGGYHILTRRDRARWERIAIPNPTGNWTPHACPGPAGQQMELDA